MYTYKALIIDVYDGDTVTALIDLGLHVKIQGRIRLKGINTPELHGARRADGLISKARTEELVLNKEVIIKTYRDKQEKYGRWLGEIFMNETDTKSVNQILLDEGLAVPYYEN